VSGVAKFSDLQTFVFFFWIEERPPKICCQCELPLIELDSSAVLIFDSIPHFSGATD
jgi:hypothetical protein